MTAETSSRRRHKVHAVVAAILGAATTSGALLGTSRANAQQAADQSPQAGASGPAAPAGAASAPVQLEEITVTGSRIKRTTDFTTPTPTTVIDASTMESLGIVNVGQALQMTPTNLSAFTPATTGNSPYFVGSYIPDLRGLNPYFGTRTLTLIDTQRAVPTNQGDGFDLNFIPQVLVQRIDTVTGGASAAYGSGAMSGVVNIILDRKLEGGRINADFSETSHSDARDRHVSAAFGQGFFDDRLHLVIGGEYEKQDGLGCQDVRTWCAQDQGLYPIAYAPLTYQSTDVYGTNLRDAQVNANGVFYNGAPGATTSLQSNAEGSGLEPYYGGVIPPLGPIFASPGATAVGGDGVPNNQYSYLESPVNRGVITGMATFAVTDDIELKVDLNWGKVETIQPLNPGLVEPGSPLSPNVVSSNAYLDSGEVTQLTSLLGPGPWTFSKDWSGLLNPTQDFSTDLKRAVVGLDGKFGQSSWTWEVYSEFAEALHEQQENNLRSNSLSMAMDSIIGPDGQPECRVSQPGGLAAAALQDAGMGFFPSYATAYLGTASTPLPDGLTQGQVLEALASACVPINPFGAQPPSAAALNYIMGELDERTRNTQTDVAFNTSGDYFKGVGAGPFSAAFGVEWRQETIHNDEVSCAPGDTLCQAQIVDFCCQYGDPFGGDDTIEEGYLETSLPLLKDLPLAHMLTFDLAARESRYDNRALYGDVVNLQEQQDPGSTVEAKHDLFTWKASAEYEPVESVRFRGSYSQDSRAPDFRELYYGQTVLPGGFYGYCGRAPLSDPCAWYEIGDVNLEPETSRTSTFGVVLTPKDVLSGFQFSADWFRIHITNAISQPNALLYESECQAGVSSFCNTFQFNNNYYLPSACNTTTCNPVPAGTPGAVSGAAAYAAGASNVTTFAIPYFNGAFYDERGVDFSLNYVMLLPDGSSLATRMLTTWTGEQVYQNSPYSPVLSLLGQTGAAAFASDDVPAPRWQGNMSITWAKEGFSLTPNMRWLGHGVMSNQYVTESQPALYARVVAGNDSSLTPYGYTALACYEGQIHCNYVPSYFVFGLNTAYSFSRSSNLKGLQVFMQVNNLLNKTPPFANGTQGGTNPVFFDTLGLDWRAGFRYAF